MGGLIALSALFVDAGCSSKSAPDIDPVGSTSQAILGTPTFDSSCTTRDVQELERAAWYGRVFATSSPLAECLTVAMKLGLGTPGCQHASDPEHCILSGRTYTPCPGDPLETASLDDQINRVLQTIQTPSDFHVDKCDPETELGQGAAPGQDVGTTGPEEIRFLGTKFGNLSTGNSVLGLRLQEPCGTKLRTTTATCTAEGMKAPSIEAMRPT
ncbi:MAG: hypothetical protein ABI551_23790 [Polyangiaceae bacterium]